MRKLFFAILITISGWSSAHACQVIGVGNSSENSDCPAVLDTIYRLKAYVPENSVDQRVYSTLWQDEQLGSIPLNVLFLIFGKMVNVDFYGACHSTPTKECLKSGAEKCMTTGSNCHVPWDEFSKSTSNGEWFSGTRASWYDYTQHLRQYGNYLIGYWAKDRSLARNYFVVDVNKNDLGISLPQ